MLANHRLFARKIIPKVIRTIAPNLFFIGTSKIIDYYTFNLLKILLKNQSIFDSGAFGGPTFDEKLYGHLTAPVLKI
jgi:hypothetical protein